MNREQDSNRGRLPLRDTFRALRHRNFRLFFMGQGLSLIGTWVQSVALGWLVYHLTYSALLLGVVGFCGQIGAFLLTPITGVWVDRLNKHRILLATQTLFMLQAFALAALQLTHTIQVWHVITLSLFSGAVTGFDTPTRQAFFVHMIDDREDLANAIALNSSMFNGARLLGPAAAGLLIAYFGEGLCFLINAFSYVAVLVALLMMRELSVAPETSGAGLIHQLKEGFAYTFGFAPIRSVILLLALVSLVTMPYSVLMPVFASKILGGGADTLGFLTSANGVGALVGATLLASRRSVLGLGRWVAWAAVALGAGLIVFGLSREMWLSLIALAVAGFGMITQMASSNTILQTIVDDSLRGRVMGFYTMAFLGTAPFGSLLAGALASQVGAPNTVIIGGATAALGGLAFALHLPSLRQLIWPVYCERGVLPAHLCGVEAVIETAIPPEQP